MHLETGDLEQNDLSLGDGLHLREINDDEGMYVFEKIRNAMNKKEEDKKRNIKRKRRDKSSESSRDSYSSKSSRDRKEKNRNKNNNIENINHNQSNNSNPYMMNYFLPYPSHFFAKPSSNQEQIPYFPFTVNPDINKSPFYLTQQINPNFLNFFQQMQYHQNMSHLVMNPFNNISKDNKESKKEKKHSSENKSESKSKSNSSSKKYFDLKMVNHYNELEKENSKNKEDEMNLNDINLIEYERKKERNISIHSIHSSRSDSINNINEYSDHKNNQNNLIETFVTKNNLKRKNSISHSRSKYSSSSSELKHDKFIYKKRKRSKSISKNNYNNKSLSKSLSKSESISNEYKYNRFSNNLSHRHNKNNNSRKQYDYSLKNYNKNYYRVESLEDNKLDKYEYNRNDYKIDNKNFIKNRKISPENLKLNRSQERNYYKFFNYEKIKSSYTKEEEVTIRKNSYNMKFKNEKRNFNDNNSDRKYSYKNNNSLSRSRSLSKKKEAEIEIKNLNQKKEIITEIKESINSNLKDVKDSVNDKTDVVLPTRVRKTQSNFSDKPPESIKVDLPLIKSEPNNSNIPKRKTLFTSQPPIKEISVILKKQSENEIKPTIKINTNNNLNLNNIINPITIINELKIPHPIKEEIIISSFKSNTSMGSRGNLKIINELGKKKIILNKERKSPDIKVVKKEKY